MHFVQNLEFKNAVFIYQLSRQAGDSKTSVLSKQVFKAFLDQSRAAMIKASSNLAQAKATAKANIAQQKAIMMHGEVQK